MKKILGFLFLYTFSGNLYAQGPGAVGGRPQAKEGKVYGKVVDDATRKGIDAASIQLFVVKFKNGEYVDSLIRGGLTKSNGDFVMENIPVTDSLNLLISVVGYEFIEHGMPAIGQGKESRDAGNIRLKPEAAVLENVVVTGSRPAMQMGVDRKIFNVEKDLMAAGGTAIDVMRNIPSISVDVEGNVEMRNSSPQIFIDGRPTILSLDQIPADNIERVELITNPSAKFDASSGGGVINVVLKKNRRLGLNGNVTAGVGIPDIRNFGANLNLREGKFNFFAGGNYNGSGGVSKSETYRQNKKNGVVDNYFNQFSRNERDGAFKSLKYGVDFFMDIRNTFSFSHDITQGSFDNKETQDQEYLDINRTITRLGYRASSSDVSFNRSNISLNYKKALNAEGKELTADVTYNKGSGNNLAIISNSFQVSGIPQPADYVRNIGNSSNNQYTFQIDYANPVNDTKKFETGVRFYTSDSKSAFDAFSLDGPEGNATKLPLSNNYTIKEKVYAAYATYGNKLGSIQYQAGLRGEFSDFQGILLDKGDKFGYKYPSTSKDIWNALFPSLYLTKQLTESAEIQLNYSRKLRRPNFRQINPFIDISDPLNLQQGNPALKPEFVNSIEFNFNQQYDKGNFLAVLYWRNTQGDITRYSDTITAAQYAQLNNAGIDPSAILNTYINAQNSNRYGAELTLQHKFLPNFDITPSINLQYRSVEAEVEKTVLSNEGFNWSAKLTSNYKLTGVTSPVFKNMSFQLTGNYESARVVPQGKEKERYKMDLALRKDLLKGNKGTITFAVDDVFNTHKFGSIYDTDQFYQDSYRRWRVRSYKLTVSYKFGDNKFSFFNRKRNSGDERSPDTEGGM